MELIGKRFGHIRVTEVVGQGGMGDVYGGYDEKLQRKVALKVLNADQRLDREARERLLREARALSKIEHPNICRIHDYIESDDVDLLVLEFIDGKTLGDVMAERLSRGEKLRIAAAVAGVLVAAHRAGIVHRDLKPENVMLTRTGEVKVLDFGLARWLQRARRSSDRIPAAGQVVSFRHGHAGDTMVLEPSIEFESPDPLATAVGITLGTPLYMSPEQARGELLTPASDMFSFGLLLQALFTGEDPHPMGMTAREVILRVARGETNEVHDVPGDIAALIGRLKQYAPTDRPTAVETLTRLQFLLGKSQRIARRAIAAAIILLISIGAWRYTVDLKRERAIAVAAEAEAKEQRAHAENLIEFMLGDLRKKLGSVGRLDIMDDVGKRALAYSETLRPENMSAEELARNSKALNQLGELRALEGKLTEALAVFHRSLALTQQGVRREPNSPAIQLALATSHFWVGDVYRQQGKLDDALRHYTAYMTTAEQLATRHPSNEEYQLERAYGHSVVALIYETQGQFARALEHLRLTRDLKEARLAAMPSDVERKADVALTLNRIGFVLERSGDLNGAREHYEKELATYSALTANDSRNARWKDRLVTSHNFLARILKMLGLIDGALQHRRAELATIEELSAGDPANAKWRRNLAIVQMNYGEILRLNGSFEEAFQAIVAAERTLRPLLARKETVWSWQRDLAAIRTSAACVSLANGDPVEAERAAAESVKLLETLTRSDAATPRHIGASYLILGNALSARGDHLRARGAWLKAATALAPGAPESRDPAAQDIFARALLRLGRTDEAAPIVERLTRIGYRDPDFVSAISEKRMTGGTS